MRSSFSLSHSPPSRPSSAVGTGETNRASEVTGELSRSLHIFRRHRLRFHFHFPKREAVVLVLVEVFARSFSQTTSPSSLSTMRLRISCKFGKRRRKSCVRNRRRHCRRRRPLHQEVLLSLHLGGAGTLHFTSAPAEKEREPEMEMRPSRVPPSSPPPQFE